MKKRWIFSAILMFIIGSGILYFFIFPMLIKRKTPEIYRTDPFDIKGIKQRFVSSEKCFVTDTLDFYRYEDKDPMWEENNKFGLYIYAEEEDFFEIAQNLVNSNGGEWGYVLIPFNMDDRDIDKWNRVFTQLQNKKLIPIIQLWRLDVNDYRDQTEETAIFLNRFIWPIKYRYISVYNEPNDSRFWYGRVDPEEYALILEYTINTFKRTNPDYFMLNGAFNVSASYDHVSMDAFEYMKRMNKEVEGIFNRLDGWASHPYPQPNFAGSPKAKGRWSIRAYEDELEYLKEELGLEKDLPVFITETGWAHAEGENYNPSFFSVETTSDYFVEAFENVWLEDDRVRAVTPFTVKYDPPFDHFSWVNKDKVPYLQYDKVKELDKVKGEPPILIAESIPISDCAE